MIIKLKLVVILVLSSFIGFGQTTIEEMERNILDLAKVKPELNEKVQVSVSGVSLGDFISAIGYEHNLNVSVDQNLKKVVVNNFYDAAVKDVFIFLIKKHDLIVEITGTIISFKSRPEEEQMTKPYVPRPIDVSYRKDNEFLSLNLKKDTLSRVAEAITKASENNVILAPKVKDKTVSIYVQNRPFAQVLDMMAKSNGLKVTKDHNGFYYVDVDEPLTKPTNTVTTTSRNKSGRNQTNSGGAIELFVNPSDQTKISVYGTDVSIQEVIELASKELNEHYFMYNSPEGNKTLKVENVSYVELLSHLLNGTEYTFKKSDDYYLIGNRNTEGLRATELIRLENRTIETVIDLIPAELIADIEIKEFIELNGIIVSGSYLKIEELKTFIQSVDQVVPMVQIDIIIAFSEKTSGLTKELNAGIRDQPTPTSGEVFPGLDLT